MIGKAAANLNWSKNKLNDRVKGKSMSKSEWVTNAKRLLQSSLGSKIDTDYVAIGNPEQIVTEEHLEFAKHLHEVIVKLELKPAL